MSFTIISAIYAIIVLLALSSIILGVINWIQYRKSLYLIEALNGEIDKKGHEFDLIKRQPQEINNNNILQENPQNNDMQPVCPPQDPEESGSPIQQATTQSEGTPGIEIIRNIRTSYEDSVNDLIPEIPAQQPEPAQQHEQHSDGIMENSAIRTIPEKNAAKPLILPLFSKAQNDADFELLQKNITTLISTATKSELFYIDLTNIMFLYEKELEFLKQINKFISSKGSSMRIINCNTELINVIWADDELGDLIEDV